VAVTKDTIADVVEKHVGRFGYAKTTVDEVAADLGISKKTLYLHFDSKRDMYRFVVERAARLTRSQLSAGVSALPTAGARVAALMATVLRMSREHIAETSESDWRGEYEVAADAFVEATGSLLEELVERGIAAGEFGIRDPHLARRVLTAAILEYTLMVREDPTLDHDEEIVAGLVRYLG